MLTPNDIADRLEELIREKFPGEDVYRELVPSGYERPSNLVVYDGGSVDIGHGCRSVELRLQYTMTTFVVVDEYHHSHLAALHLRQMALAGLLLPGFIKVKDRAPKVGEVKLEGGYDYDTVTVTFHVTLDRGEFEQITQSSEMLDLHLRTEVRTYE